MGMLQDSLFILNCKPTPKELDRVTDGMRVKGFLSILGGGANVLFYLGITESDIDELIGGIHF